MPNFFITDKNGTKHSFNEQQLQALAAQGRITPNTPLESDTGHKGLAGQIPGLFAAAPSPFAQSQPMSPNVAVPSNASNHTDILKPIVFGGVAVLLLLLVGGVWWMSSPGFTAAEQAGIDKCLSEHGQGALIAYMVMAMNDKNMDKKRLLKCTKYLVSKGAYVNATYKDETPLSIAATIGDIELAKFLVSKGSGIDIMNMGGKTPLHSAGNVDVAKFLVSKGADVNAKDEHGNTPLHSAWNDDVVKFLVSKGADVNAKDEHGYTPLYRAALGNLELVKFLVSQGADVNAKDEYGRTPLDIAKEANETEVVKYLSSLKQ